MASGKPLVLHTCEGQGWPMPPITLPDQLIRSNTLPETR